ncbi:MAG TPA: CocE/NonD family hydrolase [Candidatus Binatia bacterium]|jgi:predicted acyl esterase
MKKLAAILAVSLCSAATPALATIDGLFGGAVSCTVQAGGNAGERHCSGIFSTFDGAPIDVNVGFPPAPASGADGNFPIVGVFHGWGGAKLDLTDPTMQQWLDAGYAVFSMSDRGWGNSCGATDSKRLTPGVCDNDYNHLMDTRYEVRDAQQVFEALADQAATGATSGEGLVDPQKIAAMGSSYGGGISMALGALKDRKMMGAHEGSPNLDGYLVPWVSAGGKAMKMAAVQPDIPWTDLANSLQPNGHTLDYVADAPYLKRGRAGVLKQSFVAGLFALGEAGSNYAPPGADPDADLYKWYSVDNAGEPYDGNPVEQDVVDELTRHHSSYYIDDSEPPAPMLISNGFTDDLFPTDEAIRFYNRTRTDHPGTPIAMMFGDHGHQRGQNKPEDLPFRNAQLHNWFDYYVKGEGPAPFLGVQTTTQVCGGPSAGPYQAANWEAIAPGEVRVESAAQQIIANDVPTDATVGQAFDPITGSGACAATNADDQTGAATYRTGAVSGEGFTLMGAATIVADFLSPSPTAQVAARLEDVDPSTNMETLVARGLYRPEVNTTTASCQVFQLHPNGWRFAPGHIVKLELLPADQPYGRNSNGQLPIIVTNLRLRLPVLEAPDSGQVQSPSPKVLPEGYALAPDVTVGIDDTCTPGTATTTTITVTTSTDTTTTTSNTTTTTTLASFPLGVGKVKVKGETKVGAANGRVDVAGSFDVPPDFSTPPPFTVRVRDNAALDVSHAFSSCATAASGKINCDESDATSDYRATFVRGGSSVRYKVSMRGLAIAAPFAGPVTVDLLHNSAVVRSGTAADCQEGTSSLKCR